MSDAGKAGGRVPEGLTACPEGPWLALAAWGSASVTVLVMAAILGDLVGRSEGLGDAGFLTREVLDAGRAGGIGPVLASTGVLMALAMVLVVPVGLATALYLAELAPVGSPWGRGLSACLDLLATVPSVVFGLFGSAFFCGFLGLGVSLLSGGLTLACMTLPLMTRLAEDALRAVPRELREAAAATGLSRVTTWRELLLPAAAPGLVASVLLSLARSMAETAALLFTAGYLARWPTGPLDSGRALSLHVYDLAMNVPGGESRAAASAVVLAGVLVLVNGGSRALAARWMRERTG